MLGSVARSVPEQVGRTPVLCRLSSTPREEQNDFDFPARRPGCMLEGKWYSRAEEEWRRRLGRAQPSGFRFNQEAGKSMAFVVRRFAALHSGFGVRAIVEREDSRRMDPTWPPRPDCGSQRSRDHATA